MALKKSFIKSMKKFAFQRFTKRYGLLFTAAISLALFKCQSNITYQPGEILQRPVGIQVYALSNGKFRLSYYVQNSESIFDGYNLYISRESTGDNDTISPYLLNGSIPTLPHSPQDVDYITPISVDIEIFMDVRTDLNGNLVTSFVPFETGTRYFFKLRAHSRFNTVSFPSNEASAVTLP